MSQITLEKPPQITQSPHLFLQELIDQFRLEDTANRYQKWSDERLIKRLVGSPDPTISSNNLNLDPLSQLLTQAFYQTVGAAIEKRTGHKTETYVQLKGKDFSSAVIFCGGVLVLYSLIWGYRSLSFLTTQALVESAETFINSAVTKASQYLDFVDY
ncbi:MAG: DUF269 domain-containing protein [Cyanophyceae cyanobacterium]